MDNLIISNKPHGILLISIDHFIKKSILSSVVYLLSQIQVMISSEY
jgi:hypothetical protein